MSKIVKKGAGRAAHAEKTNRHAQRTPLPPRAGTVEDAKEVLATVDSLTAVQGPLVDGDAKSLGKAQAFAAKAVAAKWSASTAVVADAVELTLTRGPEVIVQAWRGGVWQYDASVYAYGDRSTKPRNASGAAKLLDREPEAAKAEMMKVAANRHFRKAEPKDLVQSLEAAQKSLPFDPAEAPDEIITGVLAGQAVVWYNRLSRSQESAIVGRKGAWITYLDDGERVVNICCPATGFRSFLVTAILRVGRGTPLSSPNATVSVEVK